MKIGGSAFSPMRKLSSNQLITSVTKGSATSKVASIQGGEEISPIQELQNPFHKSNTKVPQSKSISDLTPTQVFERPLDLFLQKDQNAEGSNTESTQEQSGLNQEQQVNADSSNEDQDQQNQASQPGELTEEQEEAVQELKARDAEVVTHENAHKAAAGPYATGGPNYDYQNGPDGKRYRVGGHVNVDTSKESTPEETIQKAQVLQRAANAPAEPSGQDRSVAASAARMEAEARQELAKESTQSEDPIKSNSAPSSSSVSSSTFEKPTQIVNRAMKAYSNTSSIAMNIAPKTLTPSFQLSA
ncbi:MAG: hypothetical protein KC646_14260 [Candidatus Cloacimonetes bacterium]|nr:hypothetical protein [Candidatus Cloacimonadota bacterium]